MRSLFHRRVVIPATLLALTAAAMGAVAYASIPSASGVINGCYSNNTFNGVHLLGVVDSTGTCPSGSTVLNWNQTGPPGPAGPQGPPGPSPTTYMRLHVIPANTTTLYEVFCDVNPATNRRDTAVAGGANYVSHGEAVGISGSVPIGEQGGQKDGDRPVGWHIDYAMYALDPTQSTGIKGEGAPGQVNAWVLCQK